MINAFKSKLILLLCLSTSLAYSQKNNSLSLDSCYAKAHRNYPLVRQYSLLEKSTEYSVENAHKSVVPQFTIAGQASYQSAVTEIPNSMPGSGFDPISKDQYRLYGELNQPLTDLFTYKREEDLIKNKAAIEEQKLGIELYKLKDRINNLFFGILSIQAQIDQTTIRRRDLEIGINKTDAAIDNGIAIRSTADNLRAELLKLDQIIIELKANKEAFQNMLSLFIGMNIHEDIQLLKPDPILLKESIVRPELALIDLQKESVRIQSRMTSNKTLPRFNLFLQGGVGRPALNMLNNDFEPYYIGGLKLNWNISSFYTNRKEKKVLKLNEQILDIQKDVFLFNTNVNLKQQNSEVNKSAKLMESDRAIIELRQKITKTTLLQLESGTATTNDYLLALNDRDEAQQNLSIHEIQLLMNQYNVQTTTGN